MDWVVYFLQCFAAGLHSWLLCISLDTLILSNYKEFQINFMASAPKDLLSVGGGPCILTLSFFCCLPLRGWQLRRGCCDLAGIGAGGGEEERGRQIWDLCILLHPPACARRQLAAYFCDSHMVPNHTAQDPGRDSPAANLSRSL